MIKTNALKGQLKTHEGTSLVRLEPQSGTTLATAEVGPLCAIGETVPVSGAFYAKEGGGALEALKEIHSFGRGPLTSVTALGQPAIFGGSAASTQRQSRKTAMERICERIDLVSVPKTSYRKSRAHFSREPGGPGGQNARSLIHDRRRHESRNRFQKSLGRKKLSRSRRQSRGHAHIRRLYRQAQRGYLQQLQTLCRSLKKA